VWDLAAVAEVPAYARIPSLLRVDWSTIADPVWRLCAKEVGLGLLQPRIGIEHRLAEARRRPLAPHCLNGLVARWRSWFRWLEAHGIRRLDEVSQAHCDAWLVERLSQTGRSTVAAEVRAIRRFADYGPLLSADRYQAGFYPWARRTAAQVAGCGRPGENTTPVIPDDVFAPLLAAALFLVQVAGPDVVAARQEWRQLQAAPARGAGLDRRLGRYLEDLRERVAALPELHPRHLDHQRGKGILDEADPLHRLNLRLLERQLQAPQNSLAQGPRRALLEEALAELGCAPGGLRTAAAEVADPAEPTRRQRWHRGFAPYDIDDLVNLVLTGCYVVVAALSGLRASELAEMGRGCVRAEQLANGMVRHRVHTKLIKGRPLGGEAQRWTVIEEVAQAFALVEGLVATELPFARFNPRARFPTLIRWTNGEGQRAFLAPIPTHWQLNPRQFRRTLARLLGFRPHGVLAGKVHLKHVSVATSEGYYGRAGSSAAAFLADVDRERTRARLETTTRLYAEWVAGAPMTGPGHKELEGLFADVARQLGSLGAGVVVSDSRLEELLRRRADTLHVAPLNYCWFVDPARARCLALAGRTDADGPLVGMCEPTRCANATIHPEHQPVWLDTIGQVDGLLASSRVPQQERRRLRSERARLQAVADGVKVRDVP
jgi:integrase